MWERNKLRLACLSCGREYPWSFTLQCEPCKGALVDVDYNLEQVRIRSEGCLMERYFDLLPLLERDSIIDGEEGNTPCIHAKELGRLLGLNKLYLKDETKNPTRTTKDRQGALPVAVFRELGIREFITSSTGNSSTAIARIVARFPDMRMHLFVGDEFLNRVNVVGAPNLIIYWLKNGTFVEAHKAAAWFAKQSRIPSARGIFFFGQREGLKTAFFEATEQIPEPIDVYIQGVSSALGVYSTYKGAKQFLGLGKIPHMPRLVCVQEETCNPMVRAWDDNAETVRPEHIIPYPRGLSKSTLRGDPSMVYPYIRKVVLDTGGTMVTATQDEMREARKLLYELEGIDGCYTSAMTVVAARKLAASGWLKKDDVVMLNITGADREGAPYPQPNFVVEKQGDGWSIEPFSEKVARGCLDRVYEVIRATLKIPEQMKLDTEIKLLGADLALDSVAQLEFVLALEKEFGLEIPPEHITRENFLTIGHVADYLRKRLQSCSA
jgi:threonine synthase